MIQFLLTKFNRKLLCSYSKLYKYRLQAIMTDPTDTAVCMGFDRSIAPKHDSGLGYYGFDTIFITW